MFEISENENGEVLLAAKSDGKDKFDNDDRKFDTPEEAMAAYRKMRKEATQPAGYERIYFCLHCSFGLLKTYALHQPAFNAEQAIVYASKMKTIDVAEEELLFHQLLIQPAALAAAQDLGEQVCGVIILA